MSDELYLVAHKVRGEAAFDIAIKQRCGICNGVGSHAMLDFETGEPADYEGPACDECDGLGFWWICSTSGHRAYPYWWIALNEIPDLELLFQSAAPFDPRTHIPDGTPDHYKVNTTSRGKVVEAGRSLLASLGLAKPPIRRRI